MQKKLSVLAAFAMAFGGMAFCVRAADVNPSTPANDNDINSRSMSSTTRPAKMTAGIAGQVPQGIEINRNADDSHIRETLANATQAIFNEKYGDLASYVAQANRNNVGDLSKLDSDGAITKHVNAIDQNWQKKFSNKFNVHASAFGPNVQGLSIAVGQITNPALLSNWPLENRSSNESRDINQNNNNQNRATGSERALEGSNVAIVTFPAEHNMPEVTVSMIRQGNIWKIEIPEKLDKQALHDSLVHWLSSFDQQSWPKDQNTAYRMAAHCVAAALYDVQGGGTTGGATGGTGY